MSKEIIKQDNFSKLLEKAYKVNPGMDYLTVNLDYPFYFIDNILDILDTDNSSSGFIENKNHVFTIQKRENGEWIFGDISISINDISYHIFQYRKYKSDKKKELFRMLGQFNIYGTFFRLIEMGEIEEKEIFIAEFFGKEYSKFRNQKISRIDYKYDLFIEDENFEIPTIEYLININSSTKNQEYYFPIEVSPNSYKASVKKYLEKYGKNGKMKFDLIKEFNKGKVSTGWLYGSTNSKGYILRLYDKILDTIGKNKKNLYDDYLGKGKVLRFEGEFHTKFNKYPVKGKKTPKSYTFKELNHLIRKIERFFGTRERDDEEKFLYQYKKEKENLYDFPHQNIENGCTRLRKTEENGENPYIHYFKHSIKQGTERRIIKKNVEEFIEYYNKL